MYTLSAEEMTIVVGGKSALLPKEVAEALGQQPTAIVAAFREAGRSGSAKLAVNLYNGELQFARVDEHQWDGRYQRYTVRSDLKGWSIFDHALGRCYGSLHLGDLPYFLRGIIPAHPSDSPSISRMAEAGQTVSFDMAELDAALAARR